MDRSSADDRVGAEKPREVQVEEFWIHNVRIVTQTQVVTGGSVLVREGRVAHVGAGACPAGARVIDGHGQLLIPGMIDVHIHGARGHDMMDGTRRSIEEVSRACGATGCTAFLVTSVSSTLEALLRMINRVHEVVGQEPGARIAGIHTEGPYLNVSRKGMQNQAFLRHPSLTEMQQVLDHAGPLLKMVTLAPELPGGLALTRALASQGVIVALAHSDATYDQANAAFREGASHVTHCFNGMRPIHHREPGLIVAAFEHPQVSLQAIVDDVHLHPAMVRLMHRVKGPERMVLITDALQAMGMGDGVYAFGGHQVTVQGGVARLEDGTLASSTITMNQALRKTTELGIALTDSVRMAATTPADLLGLPHKGRIAIGADADLVLLDSGFQVIWTLIGGELVYGALS